jgi:3-hydroxyacyl-[acyl-carrier-protein] dehydratase
MLSASFFDIQSFSSDYNGNSDQLVKAVTLLNPGHHIFDGHFPGNPVVPGVCQVQMVKELVEKALDHPVRLFESDTIKFLSMISPVANPQLEFDITIRQSADKQFSVNALIGSGSTVFLKFRGKFQPEE